MDIIEIFEPSEDITVEVSDNINIDLEIINNDFIPIPIGEDCNFDIDAAVFVQDSAIARYDSEDDLPLHGNEKKLYIVDNSDLYVWDKETESYSLINSGGGGSVTKITKSEILNLFNKYNT